MSKLNNLINGFRKLQTQLLVRKYNFETWVTLRHEAFRKKTDNFKTRVRNSPGMEWYQREVDGSVDKIKWWGVRAVTAAAIICINKKLGPIDTVMAVSLAYSIPASTLFALNIAERGQQIVETFIPAARAIRKRRQFNTTKLFMAFTLGNSGVVLGVDNAINFILPDRQKPIGIEQQYDQPDRSSDIRGERIVLRQAKPV